MVIPIRGQYEQICNAAALEQIGIKKLDKLDDDFTDHFHNWISSEPVKVNYDHSTHEIVDKVMQLAFAYVKEKRQSYTGSDPDLMLLPS